MRKFCHNSDPVMAHSPANSNKSSNKAEKQTKTADSASALAGPAAANPKKSPAKKPSRKKKPARSKKETAAFITRPTPEEEIVIGERRELVVDLRKKGASIRQIAKLLKQRGFEHHSIGTVHADLEAELAERAKRRLNKTDSLAALELEKLDNWEFAISPLLEQAGVYPEVKIAVVRALALVQNQRDKFERITKPVEIKINASEALAKLLGRKPEDFPSNVDSSDE